MIVTADFDWLMSHMDSLMGRKCPVYVYYNDGDSIPVAKMQDFMALGANVHMVPVTDELHNPWLLAFTVATRANAACDPDLYFAFEKDYGIGMPSGESIIKVEGARYYLHFVKELPDISECRDNVLSVGKRVEDLTGTEVKDVSDGNRNSLPDTQRCDFDEFLAAIPSNAVPVGMTREDFASELYDVLQYNSSDCEIIDLLVEKLGPAAEKSIEILNASDAMRALKDIAWCRLK